MQRLFVALFLGTMAMLAQQPQASPVTKAAQSPRQGRVKEQALLLPQGSSVEVRLSSGQRLRGRIGVVSDEGLALRSVFDNKIEERTISFADIKSVRYYSPMMARMTVSYIIAAASLAASVAIAATH